MGSHRRIPDKLPRSKKVPRSNQSGRFTGGGMYFILIFFIIVAVMAAWIYSAVA